MVGDPARATRSALVEASRWSTLLACSRIASGIIPRELNWSAWTRRGWCLEAFSRSRTQASRDQAPSSTQASTVMSGNSRETSGSISFTTILA
jgi:hypothetical protein